MPVYARTPAFVDKRPASKTLVAIICVHAAAVAALMAAKMEIPLNPFEPIVVEPISIDEPPPPEPTVEPTEPPKPSPSVIHKPEPLVPVPPTADPALPTTSAIVPSPDPIVGPSIEPVMPPVIVEPPVRSPVRLAARFATPDHLLRPPYPSDKLRNEEEAALRLRLTIDERGRVVNVEPVGQVDPAFFEAARKHLLSKWRYKPATEDGRPVTSTTVITLRFELEEA